MVFLNYTAMQMTAKIVYYGPGLCGKTTNLHWIHSKTATRSRGEMVSLETDADRTLFFDFLPIDLGTISGFTTRFQLYTVPGQVYYATTRKLVLQGADGVVFVADSQRRQLDENVESFQDLHANLAEQGIDARTMPLVLQYNKQDLPRDLVLEVAELEDARRGAGEIPVLVGSGLSSSNASILLRVADGAIVGTSLKAADEIDSARVKELLREASR